ncbi:MAG TPA: alpha/beta hydrolase [Polyangiaceae bacterium]|nr:alpha/beta hydrolase [Polyangiaceae bacterium]
MTFVPHHRLVTPGGASKLAFVLHGALGSGQNFSRFIQRLSAARPEYRYALVDLRHHGHSTGAPAPNTLAACAGDLAALSAAIGAEPDVIIGHSFGGKVALEFARQALAPRLAQVWVLDSLPGVHLTPDDSEITRVIAAVRAVPMPADSRRAVVEHLAQQSGLSSGLSEWMATNLKREGERYEWLFDVDAIEALMADYFRVDLWGFLETPRQSPAIELVVAERSDRWTAALRERARALPSETQVTYRELPNSGHWVHVDNPDALLAMMREHLA